VGVHDTEASALADVVGAFAGEAVVERLGVAGEPVPVSVLGPPVESRRRGVAHGLGHGPALERLGEDLAACLGQRRLVGGLSCAEGGGVNAATVEAVAEIGEVRELCDDVVPAGQRCCQLRLEVAAELVGVVAVVGVDHEGEPPVEVRPRLIGDVGPGLRTEDPGTAFRCGGHSPRL